MVPGFGGDGSSSCGAASGLGYLCGHIILQPKRSYVYPFTVSSYHKHHVTGVRPHMLPKHLQSSRISPDLGCASIPWAGTRDQKCFRGPRTCSPRTEEPCCSLSYQPTEMFLRVYPEQSHFKSVCIGNRNILKMTGEVVHPL